MDGKYNQLTLLRANILKATRKWFEDNDFLEINVPHITGATGSCEWFPNAIDVKLCGENEVYNMFLRQTGQLYLEAFTHTHNRVYTIGSSFRQERRITDRHLSEFTLIEFEGRDFELDKLTFLIEGLLKTMYKAAYDSSLRYKKLLFYIENKFNRITYSDSINLLRKHGYRVKHGDDFGTEEEIALCEILNGLPTFVTHYPADPKPKQGDVIKFFSMKREGSKTLCCDLLLPGVGESVGGAVREGNAEICKKQFEESYMYDHLIEGGVDPKQFEWYFEVLKKGKGQSSGCGIGFERVIQSILKEKSSIKEAVEIPRSPDYIVP